MTDELLVFRDVCSKKEKVLTPYQLDYALDNGYYKLPENGCIDSSLTISSSFLVSSLIRAN